MRNENTNNESALFRFFMCPKFGKDSPAEIIMALTSGFISSSGLILGGIRTIYIANQPITDPTQVPQKIPLNIMGSILVATGGFFLLLLFMNSFRMLRQYQADKKNILPLVATEKTSLLSSENTGLRMSPH